MTKKMPKGGLTESEVEEFIRKGTDYTFSKNYEGKVEGQTTFKFKFKIKPPFGAEAETFFDEATKLIKQVQEGNVTIFWVIPRWAKLLVPYIYVGEKLAGFEILKGLPYKALDDMAGDIMLATTGITEDLVSFREKSEGKGNQGPAHDGIPDSKLDKGTKPDSKDVPALPDSDCPDGLGTDGRAGGEGKDNEHEADEGDVSKDGPGTGEGAGRSKQEGGE